MKVTPLQEPVLRSLSERYRQQEPATVALFGAHPGNREDWHLRAEWLDRTESDRADRARVAQALKHYQIGVAVHPAAQRSLERLGQPGTLAVVGGQQAGLFGGALFIFYKALTVIQTARRAERQLGRTVVPVFWIAGEDHDFDEANHVYVQAADGGTRRIRIARPEGARLAVSRTKVARTDWDAALGELASTLPDTEFKPQLLAALRNHTEDSPTLSLAFARLLAEWFGPDGLVLLDADDPGLRELESPMFRRLIERNDELESALGRGERAVLDLGLPLQAETAPGSANLFLHHDMGRLLLSKENGRYADRRGLVTLSQPEMLALTEQAPDRLSTNALTRPLMQDFLLPVLAAVLGPSELAYWGVLRPAFESFGLRMPILVPRQSYTYLEPSIAKLLGKYGLTPEQAMTQWEEKRAEWLSAQDRWDLEGTFRAAREQFIALYDPVLKTVASLQPGLAALSENNRDRILEQIAYLENRSRDALSKQHEAALRHWDRIRGSLAPEGKAQERVYGTLHFWNRYGPRWMADFREVPLDLNGSHRLVELA
ncbi:bacillithiol biosynthesis cysteine-adding enzyme BshC [Cohnella sp. CFH 77786]|uniref:bacillithiol biosynthesis cysteine-adding enzyme BshC n=1 Tax=Cohnella sp. CFH 77786 TaxID=2662265 RepID=UPI001C60CABC|nr:bacillithiol biosynthesis cysteine-adding enzyme BshC [Cohnella sp. CFH 77786]